MISLRSTGTVLAFLTALTVSGINSATAADVNAYWKAPLITVENAEEALAANGFTVLCRHRAAGDADLTVLVVTADELEKAAAAPTRGFAAILRILVNNDAGEIRIQNPAYFLNAFLQKGYDANTAAALNTRLKTIFGSLEPSADVVKESKLAKYHYMMSMPYYNDVIELAAGTNAELLGQYEQADNGLLFKLELANGSVVLAPRISTDTESFVKTIGTENAVLLPYTVLIEDSRAVMLHPRYYIALSYPLLTMGQFMKIVSTPGKIENALKEPLK